jgi:hypothetical protein
VAGDGVGLVVGFGVGLLVGFGVGLFAGDGEAVGLGEGVGLAHAIGLLVIGTVGTAIAFGPVLAKYRASGTTIMPTMTASTKVTAPHSRLMKAQLTRREF